MVASAKMMLLAAMVAVVTFADANNDNNIFLKKVEANGILSRVKRLNKGFLEETWQGNLERECIEEVCTYEEAFEVFDDTELADVAWKQLTEQCDNNPCNVDNTDRCENVWNDYICHCNEGYQGPYCDMDINECSFFVPQCEFGDCANTVGSYNCTCFAGYTGRNCEFDIDECDVENACNGGECTNTPGAYDCDCLPGWMGQDCTEDIDECATRLRDEELCYNGGECHNTVGSYKCNCPAGWTGPQCKQDVDECEGDPCQNDGSCVNTEGSYWCNCQAGWSGTDCSEDIDECAFGHCPEGSSCVDAINSFTCMCPSTGC